MTVGLARLVFVEFIIMVLSKAVTEGVFRLGRTGSPTCGLTALALWPPSAVVPAGATPPAKATSTSGAARERCGLVTWEVWQHVNTGCMGLELAGIWPCTPDMRKSAPAC